MVKRLLNANTSDINSFTAQELKQSIKASEGRTILSENVVVREPVISDITNSEVARAFGADLILLNAFDVENPIVLGMYDQFNLVNVKPNKDVIHDLKRLVGRPIGLNLEPVDDNADMAEEKLEIPNGRKASEDNFKKANELGFDFICLTGNPGSGVTNEKIVKSIKIAKEIFNGLVIAGKMHGAGVSEAVVDLKAIEEFIDAGADIILVPAVGTVWGLSDEEVKEAVRLAHSKDALVMSAIGTSQEGSDEATVREIAVRNKVLGIDIQHIGDAGYAGLAPIENIFAMSKAIRGQRHTVSMIARSILR
ncbi:haloacid dehalogenase-like hydrolase [Clostridium sardiniense]|uniref:DUF7916 family protein n=1 Tax=Clostridium sardiniense TaxID=29369 RepID=UPI001959A90B|nr:haloacid dehalogenase-like hydrolase [Clostridium sardiniense]MBM7834957.1 hypothetical protein [Clostridium sardiniense]